MEIMKKLILTSLFVISHGKGRDAMRNYLKDTAYIGKYKLYRKDEYLENYIPAIIDTELFYEVQNLLQKRQRTGVYISDTPALFAGITYCAICQKRMTKKADNRVKSKTMRYCCDNASRYVVGENKKKCTNSHMIREDKIENFLIENIKTEANKYIIKNSITKKKISKTDNTRKIKLLENKIYKLKDLYLDDLIDKKIYESDYKKYASELENLKKEIFEEKTKDFSQLEKLLNMNVDKIYSNLNPNEKRQFWLNVIDKLEIKDGKIEKIIFC